MWRVLQGEGVQRLGEVATRSYGSTVERLVNSKATAMTMLDPEPRAYLQGCSTQRLNDVQRIASN